MNQLKWLLRRELWEHKGMLLWTPVAIGAGMTVLGLVMAALALANGTMHGTLVVNGDSTSLPALLDQGASAAFVATLAAGYTLLTAPLFMMLGLLVFFYCLGAMHDERRDRSILFWKSLPVSDRLTVASKALTALLVAPLITIGVAIATSLALLLVLCCTLALHGTNVLAPLLRQPELYLAPLNMLALLPLYALWALPTVGWLLMVSAWARSKVLAWAIGVPLLAGLLVIWVAKVFYPDWDIQWLMNNVIARAVTGVFPGHWLMQGDAVRANLLGDSWQHAGAGGLLALSWTALASLKLWLGAVVGMAMLQATVRLRGWRMDS